MKTRTSIKSCLVTICAAAAIIVTTATATRRYIGDNPPPYSISGYDSLTKQEKGLAKRVYGFFGDPNNQKYIEQTEIDPNSDTYKKWGFGEKQTYTGQEICYLLTIEEVEKSLREYNLINPKNEGEFLREFDKEYGKAPRIDDFIKKHPKHKEFFEYLRTLTGHNKLTDRDKIFLRDLIEDYFSALQG